MYERTSRIPSLDGLRAVSIAMVVICHGVQSLPIMGVHPQLREWMISLGPLGVRVFFVISGFLITTLLLGELATTARIRLSRFYFRRTLRIFPPFYFFILVVLLFQSMDWLYLAPNDLFHSLTYTTNYYPSRSWYLGHSWSLAVEEQFYLLWPLALLLLGRRKALWVAAALVLLCPLVRLAYTVLLPSLSRYELGYRFETMADSIAVGCLLAGAYGGIQGHALCRKALQSKVLICTVSLIVLFAAVQDPRLRSSLLLGFSVQNVGIAFCIMWCITNYSGRVGRALNSAPLVFIGMMSYSIYIWQQLFLIPDAPSATSTFPWNLLLVGVASLGSYFLVERPALRIRHWLEPRFYTRQQAPGIQSGPHVRGEGS